MLQYFYLRLLLMSQKAVPTQKIVKTFNDTNYFAIGTYKRDYVELFSTATLTNFITKTILAPLERWRIVKQTQLTYELRPVKFTSFTQYLKKAGNQQGWLALWRGNATNIWLHSWQVFFQIFIFDSLRATFNEWSFDLQNNPVSKTLVQRVAGPLITSACSLAITHPIDLARVRISMNYYRNPNEILFNGILSCWSFLKLEQRSARGIYRGYLIANLISILHLNIYINVVKLWETIKTQKNQIMDLVLSHEAIGSVAALLILHPLDTIKKCMQLNNQSRQILFKSSYHVLLYFREYYNLSKLYQGLSVSLIRQLLYCPIFMLTLPIVQKNVNPF